MVMLNDFRKFVGYKILEISVRIACRTIPMPFSRTYGWFGYVLTFI